MTTSPELKTSLRQRIAVILVAIVLLGSTVALYVGIVLSYDGTGTAAASSEKETRFNELYSEFQTQVAAQAAELSPQYFDTFAAFKSEVKAFNAAAITEVTTRDLKVGTGTEVTEDFVDYSAYYIGFLSDGTVFESSFNDFDNPTALNSPLSGTTEMIEGWLKGIVGMKIGGAREISIPSSLAYGDQEQGSIPANSPLKFIIMLIPKIEEIDWSEEMYELYYDLYYTE